MGKTPYREGAYPFLILDAPCQPSAPNRASRRAHRWAAGSGMLKRLAFRRRAAGAPGPEARIGLVLALNPSRRERRLFGVDLFEVVFRARRRYRAYRRGWETG
jgi:hypothetical protein